MDYGHSGQQPTHSGSFISGIAKLVFGVTAFEALLFYPFGFPMPTYMAVIAIVFVVNVLLTALAACLCA